MSYENGVRVPTSFRKEEKPATHYIPKRIQDRLTII